MHHYGFDLPREAESAGVRRLFVMLQGLPPEAATWREEMGWTQADEFAASLLELTDAWGRATVMALGKKPRGKPLQIPRPNKTPRGKEVREVTTDAAAIGRFFQTMKGGE